MSNAYVKEIFSSIQGEGLYIGEMQTFIRFCKCNLNCKYCDTDFRKNKHTVSYTPDELAEYILHNEVKTVSLTGGEPLMDFNFLVEFLPLIKKQKKIYLETNGTLPQQLSKVIDFVDVVATDIKLFSATKQENQFERNDIFLNIAKQKEAFIKVVYDENILKGEVKAVLDIAKKHDLPIILQPVMKKNNFASDMTKLVEIYKLFYSNYSNTRLIPQMHKFMKIS